MTLVTFCGVAIVMLGAMVMQTTALSCTNSTDCGVNANCANSTCVCDPGYQGDGTTCTTICSMLDYLLGIRFLALPGDCSRFVQCDVTVPKVQYCGYGTVWDDVVKTCVRPANGNCNRCSGLSNGAELPYPLLCNSYWQCQGGVPRAMCCPINNTFVDGVGCVSGSCADTCPPAVANYTADPCGFAPSTDGPEYYMETVPGFGLIRRDCPLGTNFNNVTCGCHDVVGLPPSSLCPMKADIYYDNATTAFIDNSTNNAWIQVNNVALGNQPVFSGSSSLAVFALAGVTYGSNLEIDTVFSVNPSSPINDQIVLQNGKCDGNGPSFMLYVNDVPGNASNMDVTFTLQTGNSVVEINSTLTVDKTTTVRVEVMYPSRSNSSIYSYTLFDDDTDISLTSVTEVMPATTTIPRKNAALQIGSGDCTSQGFSGFVGSIYRTGIRSCGMGV
ncbi:protein PIF-like [Haliotis asinina]|uniref:protein PIF-like n=1 Tax=Haliotis asinina TaxID=109174 RepID=UPI003531D595